MADIVIVGRGPAGISAALYSARAGLNTIIVGKDDGALAKAAKIDNYYGFAQPVSGHGLIQNGLAQAERLGVKLVDGEVVNIGFQESLIVKTAQSEYPARAVVLATGAARKRPKIKAFDKFEEGKGISYCAVCDAFFYRGKDVAVLGSGEYALHEAQTLMPMVSSVTLLTNGQPLQVTLPEQISLRQEPIAELSGDNKLQKVVFKDGEELPARGLFVAMGVAGSADLARKVGALTENNRIVVDAQMATNVPGLYAAGDCTGGLMQISKAVYEGAQAATSAIKYLRG